LPIYDLIDVRKLLNTPREYKRSPPPPPPRPARTSLWLPTPFRKYKGLTMPSIAFIDPGYLYYLRDEHVINSESSYARKLGRQLRVVINRLEHMLAPVRDGERTQFVVIVDESNIFERFVITPRSSRPKIQLDAGSRIVKWGMNLHMSIVCEFSIPSIGLKRFARCMRENFMSVTKLPDEEQHEAYVENPDNFKRATRPDGFL